VTLLAGRGLAKAYGGVPVLRDVDFAVGAGEVHALVGENGAGKSTLIKILTGAVAPDRGDLFLAGQPAPLGDALRLRKAGISVVYQEFTLVPDLSAAENVFLGREQGRVLLDRAAMRRASERIFGELGVQVDVRRAVRGLSVAHQQMVEIARALALEARIVILDEPSAALPGPEVDRLLGVIRRLRDRGLGVVYTSHRLEEVFAIADRVTVLRDGGLVRTGPIAGVTRSDLITWMVGRDVSDEFPAPHGRFGETVFEVRDLRAPPRVRQVSLRVRRGEIVALAGLVGAGRTGAAMTIVGAGARPRARSGETILNGRTVRFRSPVEALEHGVAYVTEDRKARGLFALMSAEANITIARLASLARWGRLVRRLEAAAAARIARDCSVRAARLSQPVSTLSGGNQQKVLLARYLLEPPALLIVDEPTRGVDVGARAEIYALLSRLSEQGLAILMISSDMNEVLGMADRVVVMRQGRVTGELARGEATAERVMTLATGGA
jgi:rhamnose transport system ATP-binding protein